MSDRRLLGIGLGGGTIAAICCFTPVLVVLLGAFGLSAWLAYADFVLLPALVLFLAISLVALVRLRRARGAPWCAGEAATRHAGEGR